MSIARRLLLIFSVLVCCAGCDRVSKTYAESRLSRTEALSFVAGSVRLQLTYNQGAFLSLGSSLPGPWRRAIFRGGVACMLLGLLAYAVFFAPSRPWSVCAASLVFAGGASNLVDRFLYDGCVLDFIDFDIEWPWPTRHADEDARGRLHWKVPGIDLVESGEVPQEAFMAMELRPGALQGASGTVRYHGAFANL